MTDRLGARAWRPGRGVLKGISASRVTEIEQRIALGGTAGKVIAHFGISPEAFKAIYDHMGED